MPKISIQIPTFRSENEEADWWASPAGRAFIKRKSEEAQAAGVRPSGSKLVARLKTKRTTQIALRLPDADLEQARRLADRKGVGYQTLLKILVHEGLQREARRG